VAPSQKDLDEKKESALTTWQHMFNWDELQTWSHLITNTNRLFYKSLGIGDDNSQWILQNTLQIWAHDAAFGRCREVYKRVVL
jgi:hypothetical protein